MGVDLTCIQLIQNAYDGTGSWDKAVEIDFVKVFLKKTDQGTFIVFPGSESFMDWMRDFQADMRDDPDLGPIEWGFQQGLRQVLDESDFAISYPLYITGHSLGAARALIYGGLLVAKGILVSGIITFGSPRPGGGKLKKVLSPITIRSYRNGDDKVCSVPFYIPFFKPYQHPRPLIGIYQAPLPDDTWGPFRYHHSQLYLAAMEKGNFP